MSDGESQVGLDFRIDHAGIATDDCSGLADLYEGLFDCPVVHEETLDGLHIAFLEFPNGYFELLEPADEEGTIARYLDENGPGIHHLALATPDIESALDRARAHDIDLIDDQPRPGAWGHDVAFMHPNSTGGILLEFVEH
jgi:methylmalonyl-CoA/ethylmalonyl-CoA epimerase